MSPLEREIAELLLQLYGTISPDPAVLAALKAEGGRGYENFS